MRDQTPDLAALAAVQDPLGVLSVYIDVDPRLAGNERPGWEIVLRNRLREIRREVKGGETHDRWTAIEAAIDRLQPRLMALTGAAVSGHGRALFAPLSDHRVEEVRVQVPLETTVVLQDRAYLEPLARALDAGRPTGLVNVSRDGIRMVDLRMGVAEDAEWLGFDADTGHWGQRIGTPGHGPPGEAPVQTGSAQRDRFDRALEDHQIKFIGSAAGDVAETARARAWTRLAVAGDPRLTRPLLEGMPPDADLEVVTADGTFEWQRPAELAAHLAPALEEAEARRLEGLVREAAERAAANGHGATGPTEVAEALIEGRVDTLIIDPGRHIEGVRAPDGRLAPLGVVPEGADPAELEPEPRLDERMVELAVDGSARVVAVSGRAADLLAEAGGVAAITRW